MSEPAEARLARKLEAKLGVPLAKWEAFAGIRGRHTFAEGYLQAFCCVAIAVVGLWYPMLLQGVLCRGQYAGDPELGLVAVLTIIFATVFAFRATDSLCCAYQDSQSPHKRKRLPMIVGIVLVCWAPTLIYTVVMVGGLIAAYGR